jgi:hypothetical protein
LILYGNFRASLKLFWNLFVTGTITTCYDILIASGIREWGGCRCFGEAGVQLCIPGCMKKDMNRGRGELQVESCLKNTVPSLGGVAGE